MVFYRIYIKVYNRSNIFYNKIIIRKEENKEIKIDAFDFLKLISKGAFGRVWIVRKKNTQDIYAMKIVNFAEKVLIKNYI